MFNTEFKHILCQADNQVKLLRQAAAFHFKGGDPQKAADCLEQVWKLDSSDTSTLARLVLLYSQVRGLIKVFSTF